MVPTGGAPGLRASDVYRVEVRDGPRRTRLWRALVAIVLGLLTLGAGPTNPGGRRFLILRRDATEVLAEVVEDFADEQNLTLAGVLEDLDRLSPDEFAARWISASPPPG